MVPLTIRGAREHNLKGLDLVLPRQALIVVCGVSGSGKSSLAFDTVHAEGQRRYLQALDLGGRGVGQELPPPRVDAIDGLPPSVALAQRLPMPGPRASVASASGVHAGLRALFGRAGTLHCPRCDRAIVPFTHDEIVGSLLRLPEGSRLTLEAPLRASDPQTVIDEVQRAGFSRLRVGAEIVRLDEIDVATLVGATVRVVVDRVRVGPDRRTRLFDSVRLAAQVGGGVVIAHHDNTEQSFVDRPHCVHDGLELPALEPAWLSAYVPRGACGPCGGTGQVDGAPCPDCHGSRLSPVARRVRWRGITLAQALAVSVDGLYDQLDRSPSGAVEEAVLPDLRRRVQRLRDLGLGELELQRGAAALSTGERRRLRLAKRVAAPLSGVLYVLDEPAAGLDPVQVKAVVALMRELVATGNTVLAVEHDRDVVRAADHIVEVGPGAGAQGGELVFQGTPAELFTADTHTGRWLSGRAELAKRSPGERRGTVEVRGLTRHGLVGLDVDLPVGLLTAIAGPSGSGKSTLLDVLAAALSESSSDAKAARAITIRGAELGRVVVVDRSASRSPRSSPATFTGAWDVLRTLLAATREAQVRGLSASAFSTNVKGGRCEACQGSGVRRITLDLVADVFARCSVCDGKRFSGDVLEVRWKGLNASELLSLSVDEARPLLAGHPRLDAVLGALQRVSLGYVQLGQPAHTLSGGEARRLRLARELARADRLGATGTVYLVDEPTIGLHPRDVEALLALIRALTDDGGTVWVATADGALAEACDVVVNLDPSYGQPCG